jgi:hypothetical protein
VAVSIAGLALGLWAAPAQGAVPDAGCPGPMTGSHSSTTPDGRDAQTFTAIHTGTVTRAQIEINKLSSSTDFHLQILATNASGVPIDGVLGSATIPDGSVPLGPTTLDGTFTSPAPVVAGQTYALVVTRPGGNNYPISERAGDACPGQEFKSNTQTGTFFPGESGFDHIFQVFVEPPLPPGAKPSNAFTVGKVKKRKLILTVPGPGSITVANAGGGGKSAIASAKKLLRTSRATATAAGRVKVALRLTKTAKARLASRGKLKARAAITFTPTGGDPNTQTAKLKIKR